MRKSFLYHSNAGSGLIPYIFVCGFSTYIDFVTYLYINYVYIDTKINVSSKDWREYTTEVKQVK